MTFQKGHTAWNKNKKIVKVKNEPGLFDNNAPIDIEDVDLDSPSQRQVEYTSETNKVKKEGFFARLFRWFR